MTKKFARSLVTAFAVAVIALAGAAVPAGATDAEVCSAPQSGGPQPVASDCLFILTVAVGLNTCSPECVCIPTGTEPASASDALLCLNAATGQPVTLACPCEGGGGGGGGGGGSGEEIIGVCAAGEGRAILGSLFPGVPGTDATAFTASAGFAEIIDPGGTSEVTIDEQTIGDCMIVRTETTIDPDDLPTIEVLDPGAPGMASNGTTTVDLEFAGGGFAADGDLSAQGFGDEQTIMFSFPGGDDINSFQGSVDVPTAINVTSPDITDDDFDIPVGSAFTVSWTPAPDDDGDITVTISTLSATFDLSDNSSFQDAVTIVCTFPDSAGTGTVPAAATALLIEDAPQLGTLTNVLTLSRENTNAVGVTGSAFSGTADVLLAGTTSVSRTYGGGFDFPFP